MKVAVLGAGVTGLVAAHRLTEAGHRCDVYERWPGLGGQVATMDVDSGQPLERYYHHLFTSDVHIAALYRELGMEDAIEWLPSSVAIFTGGRSHPFTSPLDLLRFSPLSLPSRIRMGIAALRIQRRGAAAEQDESRTAQEWISSEMGTDAWDVVWGPLLRGKFGDRADEISMGWLQSKLTVRRAVGGRETRRELLGYPRGSWQPLLEALRDRIVSGGGRVLEDRPAQRVGHSDGEFTLSPGAQGSYRSGHDPRRFQPAGEPARYEAVVATVPSDIFTALLDDGLREEIGADYLAKVESTEYQTALCLLLELDRPFGRFYWTNIADPELPFVGLIEHTNLVGPEHYGGRRFLYVANYLAPDDELLDLDDGQLLERYAPGLTRVRPEFSLDWVRRSWAFREPAAQPIVTVGYRERMPAFATGVPGLVLANTTQIYPEDRGTNYSVRLGTDAAATLLAQSPSLAGGGS